MARSTAAAGHDTHLYAPIDAPTVRDGVKLHPAKKRRGRLMRFVSTFEAIPRLMSIRANIYHFHDPELMPAMLILRTFTRAKVIMDVHEYNRAEISAKHWIPKIIRWPLAQAVWAIEKISARQFDCTIAATRELAAVYAPFARRITFIRNFDIVDEAELDVSAELTPERDIDIIHVGSTLQPRFDYMIEIARHLRSKTNKNIRWCFLGVDTRLVDISKVEPELSVEVLPRVPFERVAEYYARSKVGISYHPYNDRFIVALPIKIFEYMKHGLTVVMSDLPPVREFVRDEENGYLVTDNRVQSFAETLERALERAPDKTFAAYNRELILNSVNWDTENRKLQNLYTSILPHARAE